MSFSIRIKESAAKELRRVAKPDRARIVAAIDRLAETPHLGTSLKGDLRGLRRIRVGDYRILYEVRDKELVVLVVRHMRFTAADALAVGSRCAGYGRASTFMSLDRRKPLSASYFQ